MDTADAAENPLGYEKIGKLLKSFAIPGIVSLLINSLYNIVDQIFIGQGVGFLGNGATNIIAPITVIAIAIAALFGDGLAAYFSLHLGKGESEKVEKAVGSTLIVSAVIGLLFSVLAFLFIEPLCLIFGATENILPYALDYGRVIVLGFPFVIVSTVMNAAIRADGSPRYSMITMVAGALLNTVLDPIFIFVFHWGVQGAAYATVYSQFVSLICNLTYLLKFKSIHLSKRVIRLNLHISQRIMKLGFASCLNNLTNTLMSMLSNNMFAKYGALSKYGPDIPITTFGLTMKICTIGAICNGIFLTSERNTGTERTVF